MAAGIDVMNKSLQAAKWTGGKMVGRLVKDTRAAWGNVTADSARRYAKGIGMHALAGAVVGGSYSGYKGEDVVQGAWRGAKTGAMVGLGASAYRNREFLLGPGRFGISTYKRALNPPKQIAYNRLASRISRKTTNWRGLPSMSSINYA